MKTGLIFLAARDIEPWETVRVWNRQLAYPIGGKEAMNGTYVYGVALSAAGAGEFVTVDVGDAIPKDGLKPLDGAEAELKRIIGEVQGDG